MRRRISSFTQALCVSLIAHGLGLSGLAWWYVAHTPSPRLAALDKLQILLNAMPKLELPPAPPPVNPSTPKPKPQSEAARKKPPAPIKYDRPQPPEHDDSGEANGKGTANRSTDGRQPMQANAGPVEQADLMKDADLFADDAFLPASKGELTGNDAPPQKALQQGTITPDLAATLKPSKPTVETPMAERSQPAVGPVPMSKPSAPTAPAVAGTREPPTKLPVTQTPTPKPARKQIRGHRATLSDTESVAFAKADSVTFSAGKLEGRQGVKVKTTQPRYGDASIHDSEMIGDAPTVLGATVDIDGNVQDVQILQSSGSANIDQDRKLAVWNWVLEPKKDKDGHLVLTWVINFG